MAQLYAFVESVSVIRTLLLLVLNALVSPTLVQAVLQPEPVEAEKLLPVPKSSVIETIEPVEVTS